MHCADHGTRPMRCINPHRSFATLLLATDAIAAVEFAVIAPLLAGILVPVTDLGMCLYQKMQVQNSAQAGAQYASAHGWNSTSIQNAVTGATRLRSEERRVGKERRDRLA